MVDMRMFERNEKGELKYIKGSWKKMFRMNIYAFLLVAVIIFNYFMFNPVTEECRAAITCCNSCDNSLVGMNYFNLTNYSSDSDVGAVYDFLNKPHVEEVNLSI